LNLNKYNPFSKKKRTKNDLSLYYSNPVKNKKQNFKTSRILIIASFLAVFIAAFFLLKPKVSRQIKDLIMSRNFDGAIFKSESYLKSNPNDADIRFLFAQALFLKYLKLADEVNAPLKNKAREIFEELVKKSEKSSKLFFSLGYILSEDNEDADRSVDLLKKAIELNKKDGELGLYINRRVIVSGNKPVELVDVYERIGFLLYRLKRYREAIEYYDKALGMHPKTLHFLYKALIYKDLSLYDKAKEALERVILTESNDEVKAKAYFLRANIEFKQGHYDKAEEFYKKVLKIDSQNAESYYYLGKISHLLRKNKEFREYMKKAAQLGHKRAQIRMRGYGVNSNIPR
jgi:tetratricopeptide (TPR) repeat protein